MDTSLFVARFASLIANTAASFARRRVKKCYPQERFVDIGCRNMNLKVKGDVKIVFFDHDQYSQDDKMCHLWFHTAFVERNFLVFDKSVVDKACKVRRREECNGSWC